MLEQLSEVALLRLTRMVAINVQTCTRHFLDFYSTDQALPHDLACMDSTRITSAFYVDACFWYETYTILCKQYDALIGREYDRERYRLQINNIDVEMLLYPEA